MRVLDSICFFKKEDVDTHQNNQNNQLFEN